MQYSASQISILAVGMSAAYVPPYETGAAHWPLLLGSSAPLGLNQSIENTFLVYCIPTGVVFAIIHRDNAHSSTISGS